MRIDFGGKLSRPARRRIGTPLPQILHVFEGRAEVWIGEALDAATSPGQLVVVPAGRKHGFSNTGNTVLRIQPTLAESVFEAAYDDKRETPRRYLPG